MARGSMKSDGIACPIVHWVGQCWHHRFAHLAGLTLPGILSWDFLTKVDMVLDFAYANLKPFAKALPVSCHVVDSESGCARVSNATPTSNMGKPSWESPTSVG